VSVWAIRFPCIFIPAHLADLQGALGNNHDCPVIATGFSETFARTLAPGLVPQGRGQDWFDELAARPLCTPLPHVREHNEKMLASIWTAGIPDMPSPPRPQLAQC
jgi:hypothetical protein